jgi:streptogramin lyase
MIVAERLAVSEKRKIVASFSNQYWYALLAALGIGIIAPVHHRALLLTSPTDQHTCRRVWNNQRGIAEFERWCLMK